MLPLTTKFLDVANFTSLTPLSLRISCELSFQIVGLQIIFHAYLRIEIAQKNLMSYLGN
jgi:hypothetical protein